MTELVWALIRQDDNGNHYRVSRFRTREEAESVADRFEDAGQRRLYRVEQIEQSSTSP
ncbi:SPOR domain-containing protein [Streptomyces sp. SL13]|uniref:SPOR domain-containing protein n=1 Tax=Streptantibioticus silvisoli TaxID=2705255 RepID=A0AA90KGF2_9ACTN|nr:SPOR domain-containing protein [Streptantibioticus silvisoli]MDI5967527.1 SPOR domain-containing protein [Streptantibioticus silvisoli]MDI5970485.1 SPOR domain-containing protein [Streptantibioticus silvisoli]